jgi:hypothetical protein
MNWNSIITVDLTWLSVIVATALPAVVALITNRLADSWVKAVALIALSIVAGWLSELQAAGGSFELGQTVVHVLMTFAIAVVAHYGALKPVRITGSAGVIQTAVPAGLGRPVAAHV